MAGITPAWDATQLGHALEFFRVYSRWVVGADPGAENRKLDAHVLATRLLIDWSERFYPLAPPVKLGECIRIFGGKS